MKFFENFDFDTLINVISCSVSIFALFVSGKAYKNSKVNENSFKIKKSFKKNSNDESRNAGGDYYEGINGEQLAIVMKEMNEINKENFSVTLNNMCALFQETCKENLRKIIEETRRIIEEQKINVFVYTKIDWIHVFFESAKNSSDTYMQNVWAKVLAQELSKENSFSYKTLDVLKNMSSNEFKMFEKLSSLRVIDMICEGDYLKKTGFDWMTLHKMNEYGVIFLERSQRKLNISSKDLVHQIINDKYIIVIKNNKDKEVSGAIYGYPLTNVAKELLSVVDIESDKTDVINISKEIQRSISACDIELYENESRYSVSRKICYDEKKNLLKNETNNL